jgi:hypothetical protein
MVMNMRVYEATGSNGAGYGQLLKLIPPTGGAAAGAMDYVAVAMASKRFELEMKHHTKPEDGNAETGGAFVKC